MAIHLFYGPDSQARKAALAAKAEELLGGAPAGERAMLVRRHDMAAADLKQPTAAPYADLLQPSMLLGLLPSTAQLVVWTNAETLLSLRGKAAYYAGRAVARLAEGTTLLIEASRWKFSGAELEEINDRLKWSGNGSTKYELPAFWEEQKRLQRVRGLAVAAGARGITEDAAFLLLDRCGDDGDVLWMELSKLAILSQGATIHPPLVVRAVAHRYASIFDFADAVLMGQTARALELAAALHAGGQTKEVGRLVAGLVYKLQEALVVVCAPGPDTVQAAVLGQKLTPVRKARTRLAVCPASRVFAVFDAVSSWAKRVERGQAAAPFKELQAVALHVR